MDIKIVRDHFEERKAEQEKQKYPDEMDDRDPYNPCEYSEGYNWDEYDWDSDPDWR